MVNSLVEQLKDALPGELVVFIISLLPVLELRGGLIAAALLGIDWSVAFPICVIGNVLPIPLVLLFIRQLFKLLKRTRCVARFAVWLENRAINKGDKLNKYRMWGLFLLVAVPIPGTGAWTGALVADALDIRFKYAFPVICAGIVAAGILMSILSYVIPGLFF